MIRAIYRGQPIEILDVFDSGSMKFAAIQALDNEHLVVARWPAKARYATVKVRELNKISPNLPSEPKKLNLLNISLVYLNKRQWYAGESVWLWRVGNKGAFLKEQAGFFVSLNLTGYREYLYIFQLNHKTWKWEQCLDLETKYLSWAAKAQETLFNKDVKI